MAFKKQSVEFHIESDDYFGTLAAVLDIQIQKLKPEEKRVYIFKFLEMLEKTVKTLDEKKSKN